jgi:hypothetical protein
MKARYTHSRRVQLRSDFKFDSGLIHETISQSLEPNILFLTNDRGKPKNTENQTELLKSLNKVQNKRENN